MAKRNPTVEATAEAIADAPVTVSRPAAPVLAFDPSTRVSSRRQIESARIERESALALERYEAAQKAEEAALGGALGLTGEALTADEDFYHHAHIMRDVEAAYLESPQKGREALLSALFENHNNGYASGLADGAPAAAAFHARTMELAERIEEMLESASDIHFDVDDYKQLPGAVDAFCVANPDAPIERAATTFLLTHAKTDVK